MRNSTLKLIAWLVLGGFNSFAGLTHAGTSINPVRVDVDATGRGVVTLAQSADKHAAYEITPYTWSIDDNRDVLAETEDFIASPPHVDLQPGQSRIIRVGFKNPSRANTERSYRLIIRELPDAQPLPENTIGIATVLELSLPVFIAPAKTEPAALTWSLRRVGDALVLRAENPGNRHVQVYALKLAAVNAEPPPLESGQMRYVLPGTAREWSFPAAGAVPGAWHLEATTSREPLSADLELQ